MTKYTILNEFQIVCTKCHYSVQLTKATEKQITVACPECKNAIKIRE